MPWKSANSSVDTKPPNVDEPAASVDENGATQDTPRNYILWCTHNSQPQM
jgi:hypothetical protein